MKKNYELVYISSYQYNYKECAYGFSFALRDLETGFNYNHQFIPFRNKRMLISLLRRSGVMCPHSVYRAIG